MFGGRLTLVSGSPIMSGDVTSQTLYYAQHCGDKISIGGADYAFSELSLSLSGLTACAIYDVFAGLTSGSPYLFLSAAWTNATTRASALARNNGILTDSGNTGSYLGTIQIDATAGYCTAQFSYGPSRKFGVWSAYNQQRIILQAGVAPTGAYAPPGPNWAPLHNDADNCVTMLSGLPQAIRLELAMTKVVLIGPGGVGYPSGVSNNAQHTFGIGWNRSNDCDSTNAGYTLEAGGMSTGITNGFTSSIPYISDPLTGSAKATAVEMAANYVRAWSGHRDMIMTAEWMG